MALLRESPERLPLRPNNPVTVDVSDDEEEDYIHIVGPSVGNVDDGVNDEEEIDDGESITSSFVDDMMHAGDASDFEEDDSDVCTEEEAKAYRKRIREIGPNAFILETVTAGMITAKKLCTAFGVRVSAMWAGNPDEAYYPLLGKAILRFLMSRQKLPQYNTLDDAVELLRKSERILVITGAGISTNLGIPDFRSPNTGFYNKMKEAGFNSGEEVFDINLFKNDPSIFYLHCHKTMSQGGSTTPTHQFIRLLQDKDKLLTNYTQNIDNIEESAGLLPGKLIQCHGSWATATCLQCRKHVKIEGKIAETIRAGEVPYCTSCVGPNPTAKPGMKRKRSSKVGSNKSKARRDEFEDDEEDEEGAYDILQPGVMKPDITFFFEDLPEDFFQRFRDHDMHAADLVIVIGTSMQVAPVSEIPRAVSPEVPQIFISREPCKHINFDITLLGNCDTVCAELADRAGWKLEHVMLPVDRKTEVTQAEGSKCTWHVKAV